MEAATALLNKFVDYIVNPAILLLFATGFFLFMWGLVTFLWNLESGASEANSNGKQHMLWGIIGMLIMVSVYGIVGLIENTFGIGRAGGTDVGALDNITAPANFFGN